MSDLARGLAQRGWELRVLTATNGMTTDIPVIRLGGSGGDRTVGVLAKAMLGLQFFLGSLLWCTRHGRPGDLVLIVSNPPFIGLLGPIIRARKQLQYVFVFQDLFPRSAVLSGVIPAAGPVAILWRLLMRSVCKHSARTVVLSEAMKTRLQRDLGDQAFPIEVIPNWAVEKGLPIPRHTNQFAIEHGFSHSFTLQYSGNFGRLHDMLTLLEAARLLQETSIQFVFIGGGAKQTQIEAYQKGFALPNVLRLPYQPRARLPESLAACDLSAVGLIPGAEDTVAPCKFYGILASGRGVVLIARRSCDLAELVIREGCGIVVEPGEAAELAEQLEWLQDHPDHVLAMGERSKHLYAYQFGMERSIDRYAKLMESLH